MNGVSPDATIAAAGHVTEVMGPVQAFHAHLVRRNFSFRFAMHPFGYCSVPRTQLEVRRTGALVARHEIGAPRPLSVLRDVLVNLAFFGRERSDLFVGIDNVNAFCGIVLKALGRTKRVVYYVIDYTPSRFRNPLLNALHHAVDRFVLRYADEIWNISERIAAVRSGQGLAPVKNRVVGVGVDLERIPSAIERRMRDFVLMSHLTESKGVQLAIRAMRGVRDAVPDARLLIVGTGPYEPELRRLTTELELDGCVVFTGLMGHDRLFGFLRGCGVALAPYLDDPASITYYADPTKPKEYLACGLPVIITDVPWIAELIGMTPMGLRVRYEESELAAAMIRLATDLAFNQECSENALRYARDLDWARIYDQALVSA